MERIVTWARMLSEDISVASYFILSARFGGDYTMKSRVLRLRWAVCLMGIIFAAISWAADPVPLYSYNTPPPFNPKLEDNLSDYLAQWFSQASTATDKFVAVHLPRKRLDHLVSGKAWRGAVLWANPLWFDDSGKSKYLWSDPVVADHNLVLSHKNRPVEYTAPASLQGLKLGGILGHVYTEFNSMLKDGSLSRDDAISYQQNLAKLEAGRVDVIFMPASSLTLLIKQKPAMKQWLYIAKQPRNTFYYYFFCDLENKQLMSFLNQQIQQLQFDKKWQQVTAEWQ